MTRRICALLLMGLIVVLSSSTAGRSLGRIPSYGAGAYHGAYGGAAVWGGGSGATR